VRQIYVPTNGYFTELTVKQVTETLKKKTWTCLCGGFRSMAWGFHNKFRGSPGAFDKAMAIRSA